MKRITSLLLTLIIICAALCSCSSNIPGEDLTKDVSADENKTYYFKKGETIAPTSYTDYKSAAISFSSKILSALLEDNKKRGILPRGFIPPAYITAKRRFERYSEQH